MAFIRFWSSKYEIEVFTINEDLSDKQIIQFNNSLNIIQSHELLMEIYIVGVVIDRDY